MTGGSSVELLRDIQILFESGTASGLTDRQLLERFIHHRDPSAFEVLVLRHGPMVLRVCRNLLHDPNDAQDAFQATFLILVRRSGSIRRLDSVGSWLYGVACRAAARLRVGSARRRTVEERAASRVLEAVVPSEEGEREREDFGPIVQEEVRRLPEKYRATVVLCYWEGLTQEQAAAQLGCPLGTVRSRLARARDLLRRRLTRRGFEPMAVGLESIRRLPPLAPELVQSTVQAAMGFAARGAANPVVSAAVASLVQKMLWRTMMIKLSGVAAGVMLIGLAGYGAGLAAQRAGDAKGARGPDADKNRPAADAGASSGTKHEPPDPDGSAPRPKVGARAPSPIIIYSNVPGEAEIVRIVPSGTLLKKGDFICGLNSPAVDAQLANLQNTIKAAQAAHTSARLDREVAEIAVREYVEGDYVDQLAEAEGNIKISESELALAEDDLKSIKQAGQAVFPPQKIKRAEIQVLRARITLEKAQSRKKLLTDYTRERKIKQLEAAVKKAQADEQAMQATWEYKVGEAKRLADSCTIVAPIDGRLRYDQQGPYPTEVGVRVAPGRLLFTIEPLDRSAPPANNAPATGGGLVRP